MFHITHVTHPSLFSLACYHAETIHTAPAAYCSVGQLVEICTDMPKRPFIKMDTNNVVLDKIIC